MKNHPMKATLIRSFALSAAMLAAAGPASAPAQTPPAVGGAPDTNAPTHAQYALGLLKRAADRLSAATNFTFKTTSSVEVISPVGHLVNYFSAAEVAVHRPDKFMAKKTGDGPAFDLYYDGKTFRAVDSQLGLYAEMTAPATLDALIPAVLERTGMQLPYADVFYRDVYGAVSRDLTHAYWVGKTTLDGIACDHLAFAGPGIEWQVWLGPEKDPLPRRLAVTYLSLERQPRFLVNFADWDLQANLSPSRFEFKKPAGAKPIEFRPLLAKPNN
jgi:hypothetical protein